MSRSLSLDSLSEAEAYLRITCARASRRFPVLLDMLADGRLHLSAIAKLAPHLTDEGADTLLARAVHKSKREIEELCAEVAPRPDVPARMRKLPQARSGRNQLGPGRVPGATAPAAARSASSTSSAITEPAATAALFTASDPTAFEQTGPEVVEALAPRAATGGTSEARRAVVEAIAPARYLAPPALGLSRRISPRARTTLSLRPAPSCATSSAGPRPCFATRIPTAM
jgi:glycine/D-amino acid oxidase-like deaminating enzyme